MSTQSLSRSPTSPRVTRRTLWTSIRRSFSNNDISQLPTKSCPGDPALYREYIIDALSLNASAMAHGVVDLSCHIEKGRWVNGGGFGEVYMASWKGLPPSSGTFSLPSVAIKVMRVAAIVDPGNQDKRLKLLKRELQVWQSLHHKNILPLVGIACLDGNPNLPSIVSPWMSNGNLADYIKASPLLPREQFMTEIVEALHYLHSSKPVIIHGDLKAANVMVDHLGNLYVGDFGLSRMTDDATLWATTATHAAGSTRWSAPEILTGELLVATTATDVYAFGMTCLEILTSKVPFDHLRSDAAVIMAVAYGNQRPNRDLVPEASDKVWEMMSQCWTTDPSQRPATKSLGKTMNAEFDRQRRPFPTSFKSKIRAIDTSSSLWQLACSPVDSKIATVSGHTLSVGDILTGRMRQVRDDEEEFWCVAYSPDGSMIATGGESGIEVWESKSKKSMFGPLSNRVRGATWRVVAVAFSPDGKSVVSGSSNGRVQLWDSTTGEAKGVFSDPDAEYRKVTSIAFSRCGQKVAAAFELRKSVVIWDVAQLTAVHRIKRDGRYSPYSTTVAFSPTSDTLVVGYSDGTVTMWDTSSTSPSPKALLTTGLHHAWVNTISFSADGRMIVLAFGDGSLAVVSMPAGGEIGAVWLGHAGSTASATFSSDGRRIASAGRLDETVHIWEAQW